MNVANKFALCGDPLSHVNGSLALCTGCGFENQTTWGQNSVLPLPSSAAFNQQLDLSGVQCPQR